MGLVSMLALAAALVAVAVVLYQRRQIVRLSSRLSEAARTDSLTGLLNRRAFVELLDDELERSGRTGRSLSVIVGDLDWLERVNVRYGDRTVDVVLKLVARDMRKWKRRIDSAARIGRDEFALLLPETDEGGAFLVAERLRRAAHRTFGEEPLPVTISFGVASCPVHASEREVLLACATSAMRAAKEIGSDRSVIYSAELPRVLAAQRGDDAPG